MSLKRENRQTGPFYLRYLIHFRHLYPLSQFFSYTKTLRFRPRPEIEMDQVPNEILVDIINLLPVKNQLVLKTVTKRFNEWALKTTTELNLEGIPPERWLDVAKQMPKLTTLTGFSGTLNHNEISFMRELATVNKNIVNMPQNIWTLVKCYIESVKELDPSYTGSGLNVVFQKQHYKRLLRKYHDLDIKCELLFDTSQYDFGFDGPEMFLVNEGETFNFSHVAVLDVRAVSVDGLAELLERTVNLKELKLKMTITDPSTKFHRTFEAIGELRYLKEFQLESNTERRWDEENHYKISADDYSSLRKVMSIPTLRTVRLEFGLTADHQEVYGCIIESANNNLERLDVSFPESDSLRGNFIASNITYRDVNAQHGIYAGSLIASISLTLLANSETHVPEASKLPVIVTAVETSQTGSRVSGTQFRPSLNSSSNHILITSIFWRELLIFPIIVAEQYCRARVHECRRNL